MPRQTRNPHRTQDDYGLGRKLAEKWFNHSFETGGCNEGGAESMMYCEAVAFALRANFPITPQRFDAVERARKKHDTPYYNGVCDLLVEKMKEHQDSQ